MPSFSLADDVEDRSTNSTSNGKHLQLLSSTPVKYCSVLWEGLAKFVLLLRDMLHFLHRLCIFMTTKPMMQYNC